MDFWGGGSFSVYSSSDSKTPGHQTERLEEWMVSNEQEEWIAAMKNRPCSCRYSVKYPQQGRTQKEL